MMDGWDGNQNLQIRCCVDKEKVSKNWSFQSRRAKIIEIFTLHKGVTKMHSCMYFKVFFHPLYLDHDVDFLHNTIVGIEHSLLNG